MATGSFKICSQVQIYYFCQGNEAFVSEKDFNICHMTFCIVFRNLFSPVKIKTLLEGFCKNKMKLFGFRCLEEYKLKKQCVLGFSLKQVSLRSFALGCFEK